MPALGDQHRSNGSVTANPFEEPKPRIAEFTAQEIATLQSRLDKQLGPEYVSSRPGASGQKVYYIAAEKVINLANEVFGFNGWSSAIQNIQIDFVDENSQTGKISLGLSVIVRVTLRDGTFHEDVGYGHIENCKGKAAAFEKAKKEGATDALKRALRTFGNILGNCMYDKEYLTKVSKVKVGAGKWDPNALHRHPDFIPKIEPKEFTDGVSAIFTEPTNVQSEESFDLAEFDDDTFDADDFEPPSEIIPPPEAVNQQQQQQQQNRSNMSPLNLKRKLGDDTINTPVKPENSMMAPPAPIGSEINHQTRPLPSDSSKASETAINYQPTDRQHSQAAPLIPSIEQGGMPIHIDQPSAHTASLAVSNGFYSARAINKDTKITTTSDGPNIATKFDPGAESPSIRKTEGIERSKTTPIRKDLKMVPGIIRKDSVDPKQDVGMRVGMPGQNGQNHAGKSQTISAYRPPTRRGQEPVSVAPPNAGLATSGGGADRMLVAAKRSPLVDVSNLQQVATARTTDGIDAKRQRVSDSGGGMVNGVYHKTDAIRPG